MKEDTDDQAGQNGNRAPTWLKGLGWWLLGALSALILGFLFAKFIQSPIDEAEQEAISRRYVAVFASTGDPSFTIPFEFRTGFGGPQADSTSSELRALNRDPVQIIYFNDNSPATAQLLIRTLIHDPNCVLIVGGSNSELTRVILASILAEEESNRPGLIMPIATANSLTVMAQTSRFRAILRLVPSNEDQAVQIKSFVANRRGSHRVVILEDEENQEYSHDLANDLSDMIRDNGGTILQRVSYGNARRLTSLLPLLRSQPPDFIIFVGISNNGLILVDDMLANRVAIPVIFTDGGTVNDLIDRSRRLPRVSYFLSAVRNDARAVEPTYRPIGTDTRRLLASVIGGARDNSRAAIREYISENRGDIVLYGGEAGDYRFNAATGENVLMHFSIYRNTRSGLEVERGY